jgi:hypothetical protein
MYRLTAHALQRMRRRRIHPAHVAAALENPTYQTPDGAQAYYDPTSRVRVMVRNSTIVTIVRAKYA